ncbi:DUF6056 family protein [Methylobacillus methanolivorans]
MMGAARYWQRIQPFSLPLGMMFMMRGIWIVTLALFLAWVLWNAFQAIPAVDDFCYGYGGKLNGVLGNVIDVYQHWSGRYTATFLITLFGGSERTLLHYYFLVPLSILLLNIYAVRRLLSVFCEDRLIIWLGVSALLLAFFQMRQSLFWLAGGATYGIASGIFLLLIAEEFKILVGRVPATTKRLTALCAGTILLAGCNEGAMLAHIALLLPLALLHYTTHQSKKMLWVLAAAILAALVAGAAPGNFARASIMHEHLGVFQAVWLSLVMIVRRYLLALVLLIVVFHIFFRLFPSTKPAPAVAPSYKLVFVLLLFFALWAGIFARAYVMGDLGPSRTRTQDFMLIILMAFCMTRYGHFKWGLGGRVDHPGKPQNASQPAVWGIVMVTMVSLVLLGAYIRYPNQSWGQVMGDVRASAELRQFMDQRFFQVSQAGKSSSLEVDAYAAPRKPITFFSDITPDTQQWENTCFSNYFGLQQILTKTVH